MIYSDLTVRICFQDAVIDIIHKPTGLTVRVDKPYTRKNKYLALLKLEEMIYNHLDGVAGNFSAAFSEHAYGLGEMWVLEQSRRVHDSVN